MLDLVLGLEGCGLGLEGHGLGLEGCGLVNITAVSTVIPFRVHSMHKIKL